MKQIMFSFAAGVPAFSLSGCVSGTDIVKKGDVSLERVNGEKVKVRVTWGNVFQNGPELRVSGRVVRRGQHKSDDFAASSQTDQNQTIIPKENYHA